MLSDRCLSVLSCPVCLSVLSVTLVYCDQTVGWIKRKLGMHVGLDPGHIALDWDLPLPPQRGTANYRSMPIVAKCLDGLKWHLEVGLGPSHIVIAGDPAPLSKRGQNLQFSANFYCGQTAGCIKMPLGMEVGLTQATLC